MYSASSRRIGPALVVVVALLALGSGTGAYVVIRNLRGGPASHADDARTAPGVTQPLATTPDRPDNECPAITVRAVRAAGLNADLTLLRYVDAVLLGGTPAEAWICRNADGLFYYQGHRKSGPFNAATSQDTILLGHGILGEVDQADQSAFMALNPMDPKNPYDPIRTAYYVSPTSFYFTDPDGNRTTYTVISTRP
jgi:hypothetical protein